MTPESLPTNCFLSSQAQAELELLQILALEDEAIYPWNPARLESENYFAELESTEFNLGDWSELEGAKASQRFFSHLDRLWESGSATPEMHQTSLAQRFADRIPAPIIEAIAAKAKQAIATPLALANQLIACVEEILPHFNAEDLQVLERPLVYAMRGTETDCAIAAMLDSVRSVEWTELSEIEQARLCLAAARYEIAQLQSEV